LKLEGIITGNPQEQEFVIYAQIIEKVVVPAAPAPLPPPPNLPGANDHFLAAFAVGTTNSVSKYGSSSGIRLTIDLARPMVRQQWPPLAPRPDRWTMWYWVKSGVLKIRCPSGKLSYSVSGKSSDILVFRMRNPTMVARNPVTGVRQLLWATMFQNGNRSFRDRHFSVDAKRAVFYSCISR
jgi:hypothetical protein